MSIRPFPRWLAPFASAGLAAALSAAMVVGIYSTLNQIEKVLPDFGFFSIRELNLAIQDVSHLQDMVTLARLAPEQAESAEHLAEANDLAYVRFIRQDQTPMIRGYPGYGPAVERTRAVVDTLDGVLSEGRPLAVHDLGQVGEELAAIKAEMIEAYYAFGYRTNADLATIQRRLGALNLQTAIVLSVLSALAIGVAVLLVNRHRTLLEMRQLAWSDSLTGLRNRAWLQSNAAAVLRNAAASQRQVALFLIDVDRFKEVNDTFGHEAGDTILRTVGRLLIAVGERNGAQAIRLGGDEFAILLPESSPPVIERVLGELSESMDGHVDIEGAQVRMSASVGIAHFPEHGSDLDALLRCADYALYEAKARGGAGNVLFSPEIASHIQDQLRLDAAIRHAIQFNELFLVWQPQYELASGRLSGVEALVHWRDPATRKAVPSTDFIPAAEKSELILEIDRFVLTEACRQAAAWAASVPESFTFSVNISARHLQRPELVDHVRQMLRESGLEPARLELEITESAFIEDRQLALDVLQQLRTDGVRIALDDFGTGYSSLSYLVDFDVTRVKIDRSFIADLMVSSEKRSVVKLIMALAHSLDLEVIAEGVESSEQVAFLMQLKCRYAQGALLSQPLGATAMTHLLSAERWVTPELIEGARRILAA